MSTVSDDAKIPYGFVYVIYLIIRFTTMYTYSLKLKLSSNRIDFEWIFSRMKPKSIKEYVSEYVVLVSLLNKKKEKKNEAKEQSKSERADRWNRSSNEHKFALRTYNPKPKFDVLTMSAVIWIIFTPAMKSELQL